MSQAAYPRYQPFNYIRAIKWFLFITVILWTIAIIVLEIILAFSNPYEVAREFNMPKANAIGYFIGAWFSGTIAICFVYLVAEIAESVRIQRIIMARNAEAGKPRQPQSRQ